MFTGPAGWYINVESKVISTLQHSLGPKSHLIKCIIIKIGYHQINESQKQVSAAKVMAKVGI